MEAEPQLDLTRPKPARPPPPPCSRTTLPVYLPPPPPPPRGQPSLSGCVAKLDTGKFDPVALMNTLPTKLAGNFGGSAHDYKVASLCDSFLAVFFPNWVSRESAIGRSPLRLDGVPFVFSNWAESGEEERSHLQHKVWIRLLNWSILGARRR